MISSRPCSDDSFRAMPPRISTIDGAARAYASRQSCLSRRRAPLGWLSGICTAPVPICHFGAKCLLAPGPAAQTLADHALSPLQSEDAAADAAAARKLRESKTAALQFWGKRP